MRGGDWLGADWRIGAGERSTWRHRFDRLSVGWEAGTTSVTVGRQAISRATTLFLTPADPFAPFDPSDPFVSTGPVWTGELLRVAASAVPARRDADALRLVGGGAGEPQVHPLVSGEALLLGSLPGASALVAPGVSWSASAAAPARLGMFVGTGPSGIDPAAALVSEFGAVPVFGYATLSRFF